MNPWITDSVQNELMRGLFLNSSQYYTLTILPIFLLVLLSYP